MRRIKTTRHTLIVTTLFANTVGLAERDTAALRDGAAGRTG
jgi:hypothetical protein